MFKIFKDGQLPTRGTKYSACVDLYAREDIVIGAGETKLIPLGVCIDLEKWLNRNIILSDEQVDIYMRSHYLQLMLRSSLSKALIIANGIGVIDMDYEGEIMIRVHNPVKTFQKVNLMLNDNQGHNEVQFIQNTVVIEKGDSVAQITLLEHKSYLFGIDTEDERTGGFGSTDKKDK